MKKGKLITIGGAIVVLALCGYFFMGTSSKGKISFQTEKVTRNSMTDVVVATGTVEPVTKVDVGTQVSGIIDRIYVDYNSVVKKGQLIAEMDSEPYRQNWNRRRLSWRMPKQNTSISKKIMPAVKCCSKSN